MNFLDKKVIKDAQGNISTDVFQKPMDTHPYLHWTSVHPPHLKKSIPYSQALRVRRICSSTSVLGQRSLEYSNFFVTCGYKRDRALSEMCKVLALTQDKSLRERERHTSSRIPFVTTYNPLTLYIADWQTGTGTSSNQRKDWLTYLENDQLSHIGGQKVYATYLSVPN